MMKDRLNPNRRKEDGGLEFLPEKLDSEIAVGGRAEHTGDHLHSRNQLNPVRVKMAATVDTEAHFPLPECKAVGIDSSLFTRSAVDIVEASST